jgi:predicted Rossmann-fold nucleotide-binding protein
MLRLLLKMLATTVIITGGAPVLWKAQQGAKGGDSGRIEIAKIPNKYRTSPVFQVFFTENEFIKYAGLIIFPGGFGTMDEMFESLTLSQTGKIENFPIILYGTEYWQGLIDWMKNTLVPNGTIGKILRYFHSRYCHEMFLTMSTTGFSAYQPEKA